LGGFLDELAIRYNLDVQLRDSKYTMRGDEPNCIKDERIGSRAPSVLAYKGKVDTI